MARVIATGGVPQHDLGRGLTGLGKSLMDFAKLREIQRGQEATNAFAAALQQTLTAPADGAQPQMADASGAAVPPQVEQQFGDATKSNPIRDAFAGMSAPQLGSFLRANPGLMRDPERLAKLMGTREEFEFIKFNDQIVRVGKTSGKVTPVFEGKPDPSKNIGFEEINGRLFRTDKASGEATEVARVDQPVKPQDALAKLEFDRRSGFLDESSYAARKRKLTHVADATEKDPGLIGGPGGSILYKKTGEVFAPGRLNVVDKTGQERTVSFSTREEMNKITEQLNSGELTETSKGGRQPGSDLGAKTRANLTVKRQEKAREELSKEMGGLLQFSNTLKTVRANPEGAFGLRGNVAKGIAGLVGQVAPEAANAFAALLTGGADEKDLTTLRTQGRALIAATIQTATGEEGSSRISNTERQLTEQVLSIFNNLTDKTQAETAMTQLMQLKLATMERLRIEADLPAEFNFDEVKDKVRYGNRLITEFGLSKDDARAALDNIIAVRREIAPLFK